MRLKVNNIKIPLSKELSLQEATAKKLGLTQPDIANIQIIRRAIDARRKNNIILNYNLMLDIALNKKQIARLLKDKDVNIALPEARQMPNFGSKKLADRPIVIGAGPAGLLATLELARYGYKPLLLERGKPVAERIADVQRFWQKGEFDPDSNVQFGAGGAGTFSDGKLTTRVNDPVMRSILKDFVEAGAPQEILFEHKPHVGTDKLRLMVNGLEAAIRAYNGEIRYGAHIVDFFSSGNSLAGVVLADGEKISSNVVVLACGHSARDTYAKLTEIEVGIEAKPFAIGVRIEHPQELIDQAQYGDFSGHPLLGAADYALVYHTPDKRRTAYSFCMCPGGKVVAAASEAGGVVVNGMSMYRRDSGVANSALVVNVNSLDFGNDPLAGVEFQRRYERLAFEAGGRSYCAPAQNVASFLRGLEPDLRCGIAPTYSPNVVAGDLNKLLPEFVAATLRAGITAFDSKIKGFADGGALLTGVETRTSAPVRILRNSESMESLTHAGLYPCGEGAGYAGGIMSAALDGYYVARAIMEKFAPLF